MTEHSVTASADGTRLVEFSNGMKTVLIPGQGFRTTICVSSQIGCGMHCAFCRAGKFVRNLSADEIVEQFKTAMGLAKSKPSSVVFMGMGEPMLNFDAVTQAIDIMHDELDISYRKISLSTCGLMLEKLLNVPFHVAVSLHSADEDLRKKLMPGCVSVSDIVLFSKGYTAKHKRGLMIEYSMISGVNDSDKDLKLLLSLDWPKNVCFNLIELNDYKEFRKSRVIDEWHKMIMIAGYECRKRESKGRDISAACGMLDYASTTQQRE